MKAITITMEQRINTAPRTAMSLSIITSLKFSFLTGIMLLPFLEVEPLEQLLVSSIA